ncbi:hypothetical protein AB5L52_12555 [Streptomyces sp. CG4]|uniref:WXG100 family type VII secretion target n=1 Tax=Streptomyces sp. CG4 TaxID=408783 RepID=UPI0034E22D04
MDGQSKNREPQLARTDFESMTHEQLAAMLDSAHTAGASHLSSKLSKAASTITKIGDDLMTHVKGLEWQGQAGDAFRGWGGQTASATLRLGQYAEVAARWMGTVSQAIGEAKAAMPDVSETTQAKADLADAHTTLAAAQQPGARNDPAARKQVQTAQTDAAAAQKQIEAARGEAIQQMRKLGQTYEFSAQQVNSVTPPTFSPPANHMDSRDWFGDSQHISVSSGGYPAPSSGSPGRSAGGSISGQPGTARPVSGHTVTGHAAPVHTSQPIPHGKPVDMGIDGTDPLPRAPVPSTTGPTASHTSVPHPELPVPSQQPTTMPPVFTSRGRAPGTASGPRVPSPSRLPQTTGPEGVATGRVPQMPSPGGTATSRTPQLPRETGIVGGRPVSSATGRPQSTIPRGTVIGDEGAEGRTGTARGGIVQPSMGGAGSGSGMTGGRRLASETGGVVGNRQVQPGRTGGRPFTPGGSGLVRSSSDESNPARFPVNGRTEAAASSTSVSGSRKDRRQEQRADYLVEDEETWASDRRRSVPPVVG